MDKKTTIRSKKVARVRGWIQAAATLLTNIHIPNLFKGKIYQGNAKTVCVPGLNCYSCPAAAGACPIGAFQAVVGSSNFKFSYYITGFFILLGVTLGRFICGFLCPFGWFQDLLHKIPGKKFSNINATKQNINPTIDENINGVVENAVIPSIAYLNNFQNDHLVSPATLSTFSYSIHFVSNPTKLNNPFEYLLYSFNEIMLSTTCLFINL